MVGCPPAEDVAAWVTASPAARDRLGAADAPRVSIVLAGSSPTIEGVLTLDDFERRVSGSRCEDVARAVSTIARLALESLPPAPAPAPTSAPVVAASPPPPPVPRPALSAPPPRTTYSAGAALALRTGAPSLAYAAGPFVDVARARWSARLGALATTAPESSTMDSTISASLAWTLGTVDLCGTLLRVRRLGLAACGALEAGVLRAQGDITESRPWVAPGADLRARLAATGALALELTAGARIPLIRDSFVFEPDLVWHDTPAALVQAGINVSVSIP